MLAISVSFLAIPLCGTPPHLHRIPVVLLASFLLRTGLLRLPPQVDRRLLPDVHAQLRPPPPPQGERAAELSFNGLEAGGDAAAKAVTVPTYVKGFFCKKRRSKIFINIIWEMEILSLREKFHVRQI